MLHEANFTGRTDWLRIVHDASIWLSLQQNLFDIRDPSEGDLTDERWKAVIRGVNWTNGTVNVDYSSCLIQYGDEIDMTLQVVFDQTYEINFTPIHDEKVNIVCTPNSLPLSIRDSRNEVLFNSTTGNVSYHIPGACWDDKEPWNFCDVPTTNFASLSPIGDVRTDLSKEWLVNTLTENDVGMYFNSTNKVFDTSWLLYQRYGKENFDDDSTDDDDDSELSEIEKKVQRWILYNQNNDGSWGNSSETFTENILHTAMASIALTRLNNGSLTEFIKDANIWISQNRPVDGWDTVKKDAVSFLAFSRSAKPFIYVPRGMITLSSNEMDIELYNPSSFDFNRLDFVLDDNLKEHIEIDGIGSLASDYFKDITLRMKGKVEESLYGYMSILNDGYEIAKVPVLITSVPEIKFELKKSSISMYNGKGTATFDITKTEGVELDCDLMWDDQTITSKQKFKIDKQQSISTDIVLSEVKNQQVEYKGRFDCMYQGMNLSFPIDLNTYQFEDVPFSVVPESINLTSFDDELSFTVYNNVDVDITLQAGFETEDPYLIIDNPRIQLGPLESQEVTISHFLSENETVLWDNIIKVNGYDRNSYVSVLIDYEAKRSLGSFFGLLITFILVFGSIGGLAFATYTYRSKIIEMLPESVKAKLPEALVTASDGGSSASGGSSKEDPNAHPMEKQVEAKNFVHVAEVVKIMKGLGKDDDEIAKRLEAEGYNKGEINELFKRVAEQMDASQTLEKEEKFMKLMKDLDSDVGAVRNKLKQDGFTDAEIKEAFKQAEEEILKKRDDLDKKIKNEHQYDISKDESANAAKNGEQGEGGEKTEEKKE